MHFLLGVIRRVPANQKTIRPGSLKHRYQHGATPLVYLCRILSYLAPLLNRSFECAKDGCHCFNNIIFGGFVYKSAWSSLYLQLDVFPARTTSKGFGSPV